MGIFKQLIARYMMAKNPNKYAKKIGVNINPKAELLGRVNFGSEPWLISIGAYTRISKNVTFWNHDGGTSVARRFSEKYSKVVKFGFIDIGDNCFIGANTTILCNVKIGDNCVIGACSLVTKDIPSGQVWGGVPAKYICSTEEYAEKLLSRVPSYNEKALKDNKIQATIEIAKTYRENINNSSLGNKR